MDVDCGNIGSVAVALERLGVEVDRTAGAEAITSADRVILPGVGNAGYVMRQIDAKGLAPVLRSLRQPMLGICLGMQLLFERSEEEETSGLGIIPGSVRRMSPTAEFPVPHMGWSKLTIRRPDQALALDDGDYVYFAHSFACDDGDHVVATADHAEPVPAVVAKANFRGVQFHPERSSRAGARAIEAFLSC